MNFLFKQLRPTIMRNVKVEKWYLKAYQAPSQMVSSFTAYLDQLGSQLPLPVSKLQHAKDLLHRVQPNISQEIIWLANIPTRSFELEVLAICIEETTCNNCCQNDSSKLLTRGLKIVQLSFCKRVTDGSLPTTTAVQTDTQATPPAKQGCSKPI